MWGGGAVLHKVKTLRQRARCGMRRLGEGVYAEGEHAEGKSGEMRRKQGERKIPQGACLAGRELYLADFTCCQSRGLSRYIA